MCEVLKFFVSVFDAIFMNEHFLSYGAGRVNLHGIIGPLIMLISTSRERMLNYIQIALIMFTQGHFDGYLKLGAFPESDVAHLYELTRQKSKRNLR